MDQQIRKAMMLPACFLAVFLMGTGAAATVERWKQEGMAEAVSQERVETDTSEQGNLGLTQADAQTDAQTNAQPDSEILYAGQSFGTTLYSQDWGLGFGEAGTKPTGNATVEELAGYNAWYLDPTEEPVIYLTFDCGFENGYTESILETLEAHNAPATFFVVGHFLEANPDLIRTMVEKGFTVGNHTYHHPDMGSISEISAFEEELKAVEDKFYEITGTELTKFYRPPQGKYSEENLQMAKEMGYETFFWSLAYVDWYVDDQPTSEEAFGKLIPRIHPGAIVLLHNTSSTNAAILDELLTRWEEMGYKFRSLAEIGGK